MVCKAPTATIYYPVFEGEEAGGLQGPHCYPVFEAGGGGGEGNTTNQCLKGPTVTQSLKQGEAGGLQGSYCYYTLC